MDGFNYQLSDGELVDTGQVVIYITPINDPPEALTSQVSVLETEPTAIILSAEDVDGDSLIFSIVNNPLHGSLSGFEQTSSNSASVIYTAIDIYLGDDEFSFQVDDGNGETSQAVINILVVPPYEESSPGDFNQDGEINIIDIVLVIEFILSGDTPYVWDLFLADINQDGQINVIDIILIVDIIMNIS